MVQGVQAKVLREVGVQIQLFIINFVVEIQDKEHPVIEIYAICMCVYKP